MDGGRKGGIERARRETRGEKEERRGKREDRREVHDCIHTLGMRDLPFHLEAPSMFMLVQQVRMILCLSPVLEQNRGPVRNCPIFLLCFIAATPASSLKLQSMSCILGIWHSCSGREGFY